MNRDPILFAHDRGHGEGGGYQEPRQEVAGGALARRFERGFRNIVEPLPDELKEGGMRQGLFPHGPKHELDPGDPILSRPPLVEIGKKLAIVLAMHIELPREHQIRLGRGTRAHEMQGHEQPAHPSVTIVEGVDEFKQRMSDGDPDQRTFGTWVLGHETKKVVHTFRDELRVDRGPSSRIADIRGLAKLPRMGVGDALHQERMNREQERGRDGPTGGQLSGSMYRRERPGGLAYLLITGHGLLGTGQDLVHD